MFWFMIDQYLPQTADLVMRLDNLTMTTDGPSSVVAPSHRIPPEIVAKIIQELLPAWIDYGPSIKERLVVLSTATSICQYWRYAALEHASLWSIVPIDRKSVGELFLRRSRNAPLFITFEVNTWRCSPAHQAMVSLLPHMQRVKKVQLRAPAPVLDDIFSTLNRYGYGAQLEEISIRADGSPSDEKCRTTSDLLLGHASTLKVLRLDVFKCRFPTQELRQFLRLSHLELLSTHDIRDVSSLLTSLPALASIKIRVTALGKHEDNRQHLGRIVPQVNLRHIHLQITCYPPDRVLDALKIQTGVHLECEIIGHRFFSTGERAGFLPLRSEFFENTSHIEELRINPPTYSGSGPNGSFHVNGVPQWPTGWMWPPIEDFSHLRKLVASDTIEWRFLKDVVRSAPQLVSVIFVDCTVTKSGMIGAPAKGSPSCNPVDADTFVKVTGEKRRGGVDVGDDNSAVVNGTLEGARLEEFKSLFRNCS